MRGIIITGTGGLVGLNLLSVIKAKHKAIIAIDKNLERIKLIQRFIRSFLATAKK